MMRWKRLFRRRHAEEQLERELGFHVERHTADLVARGLNPQDARRAARLAIGGPEQVKEACRDARGTRWIEEFVQDVRYALRALRLRPGFAAVMLLTLALGCAATTVMFAVVHSVLLKPLPYPDADRLLSLYGETEKYGARWGFAYPDFLDCRRNSHSLRMAAWHYGGGTVSRPGQAEYVDGRRISSEFFSVLGVTLVHGRAFSTDEDRPGGAPVVVISDRLWQTRYGRRSDAVGQPLVLEGKAYTVVGIAPAVFRFFGDADVFIPLGQATEPRMQNREAHFLRIVARLQPGVTLAQSQAELELISAQLAEQYPKSNAGLRFTARALSAQLVGDVQSTLWLLLATVSVVLLIACTNVASLLLARAVSRDREIAMRVALGAGRARLFRQAITESTVLALSGGVLGVALAAFAVRPFSLLWPGGLPRAEEVQLDWQALLFAIAVSILTGVLFGLAPALRAPAKELESRLRSGGRTVAASPRRLHRTFVVSEIALAFVLLIAAGMLGGTLQRLSSLHPGFDVRNVLISRLALSPSVLNEPASIRATWNDVLMRARAAPGVEAAALTDIVPMRVGQNALGYWTSTAPPPSNELPQALASGVTPEYLEVMGIRLLEGRFFDEHDRLSSEPVIVVDEVLARNAFHGQPAVGKRLQVQAMGPARVIGVVGHVRHWGLARDDQAQVRDQLYYPLAQVPERLLPLFSSILSLTVRTAGNPVMTVDPLRKELRETASGEQVLYEVRTMEQLVSASLARHRFLLLLLGIFSGLALVLACIGIYGVLTYVTSERVPEIGVRMAVGATAANVLRLVLRQSLGMIAAGVGIGLAGALIAGRILARVVEGVEPVNLPSFVIMTALLTTAAILASLVPAWRASRIDPLTALRAE
jgi:predicted permease